MLSLYALFSHPDRCGVQLPNMGVSYRARNQVCLRIRLASEISVLGELALQRLVRLVGGAVSVESPGADHRNQARRSKGSTDVSGLLAKMGDGQASI